MALLQQSFKPWTRKIVYRSVNNYDYFRSKMTKTSLRFGFGHFGSKIVIIVDRPVNYQFLFITLEVKFLMRSIKLYRVQSCHAEIKQELLTMKKICVPKPSVEIKLKVLLRPSPSQMDFF